MCGIVWVSLSDSNNVGNHDLLWTTIELLQWNKHRGQKWYGISVATVDGEIRQHKFSDIYDPNVRDKFADIIDRIVSVEWHARYPTSWWGVEDNSLESNQPHYLSDNKHSFAFNWNIANASEIAIELEKTSDVRFTRPIFDTRVLQQMMNQMILEEGENDMRRILERVNDQIDGACNIAIMERSGSLNLAKDRWGFRPLSFTKTWELFKFSSESSALFKTWERSEDITFVKTWESVIHKPDVARIYHSDMELKEEINKSRCFFETVYFADPETKLWWEASSAHRYRLWQILARNDNNLFTREDTLVIDVPSSSRDSARWYAGSKLKLFDTAITKDPDQDGQRSFTATDKERQQILEDKYIFNPLLKDKIKWKKIVLVDDSVVRGSTLKFLVEKIREFYEPSEIHLRIPSPPIVAPCYYAINLKKPSELLARKFFQNPNEPEPKELDELAEFLWADSIRYMDVDGLIEAINQDVNDMCLWCVTWNFPTPKWKKIFAQQLKDWE